MAYRVSLSEIGGGTSQTVLAGEVLHVRIGSSPVTPWAGTAPLHPASLSAELLQHVEAALRDVWRGAPVGSQIVPLPDSSSEDMAALRRSFRGARGQSLVIECVAQATAAGMHPQLDKRVEGPTPDLQRAMPTETLEAARGAILMAYDVLPALLNPATTGRWCARRSGIWRWPRCSPARHRAASRGSGGGTEARRSDDPRHHERQTVDL